MCTFVLFRLPRTLFTGEGDPRCPLCRREFQVSAGEPAEDSNDSTTAPDPHVVPAAMSAPLPTTHTPTPNPDEDARHQSDQFLRLFDIDIDMLNDTLVLTLTEEEIRLFADLYEGALREDPRQTSAPDSESADTWIVRDRAWGRNLAYNYT